MLFLEHYGTTHPGKVRKNNEDSLLTGGGRDETLFVVADGIGGFEAGEVASSMVIDVLRNLEPSGSLEDAIREANRRILEAARGDEKLSGMGTTAVAMRFGDKRGEPVVEISHVGDSRAYLVRGGELRPVTEDHSLVAELVRSGDLTRAEASEHPQKNLITRALGAEEDVEVDNAVLPVEADDRFVLCSDGLTDMVPEAGVGELLAANPRDPEKAARALVSAALDAGGADNVTVVIVDVREEDRPEGGNRRGDTQEMRAVTPEEAEGLEQAERGEERRGERAAHPQRRGPRAEGSRKGRTKGKKGIRHRLAMFARVLAVALVLTAVATPLYLWGSSRYFLGIDGGEVVVYRGLPYAVLGQELNQEHERTGLSESDVKERYREQIPEHRLYSKGQADQVVGDLQEGS